MCNCYILNNSNIAAEQIVSPLFNYDIQNMSVSNISAETCLLFFYLFIYFFSDHVISMFMDLKVKVKEIFEEHIRSLHYLPVQS
jgi:hypothetical protein